MDTGIWIVENDHYPIACIPFERSVVTDDDLTDRCMSFIERGLPSNLIEIIETKEEIHHRTFKVSKIAQTAFSDRHKLQVEGPP